MLKFKTYEQMKETLESLEIFEQLSNICRSSSPVDELAESDLDICTSALGNTLIKCKLERGSVYLSFDNILYLFFHQNETLVFGDIVKGLPIEKAEIYQDNRALIIDGKAVVFSYLYEKPCFSKARQLSKVKVRLGQDQRIKLVDYMLLGVSTFAICKEMNLPKEFVERARAAIMPEVETQCSLSDEDSCKFRIDLMKSYSDASIAEAYSISTETVNKLRQQLRYDTVSQEELEAFPSEPNSDLIADIDPLATALSGYAASLSLPEFPVYDPLNKLEAEDEWQIYMQEAKKLKLNKQLKAIGL